MYGSRNGEFYIKTRNVSILIREVILIRSSFVCHSFNSAILNRLRLKRTNKTQQILNERVQ